MRNRNILFLTLYTYGLTGGIEKVCQTFVQVLEHLLEDNKISHFLNLSLHDHITQNEHHQAFKANKVRFSYGVIKNIFQADTIILSHIHLLPFAKLIRLLSPDKKIILFAHGIEVWKPLSNWQKKILRQIDIWAVSSFTAEKIKQLHGLNKDKVTVLNHALPLNYLGHCDVMATTDLKSKYQIPFEHQILLTICRLSSAEKYKGYDLVLLALKDLIKIKPNITYILVGKADDVEHERILKLVSVYGLQKHVLLTGYVTDEEIDAFYKMADVFAMPSLAEGFGLVYIEAAANGCHVLAGNCDGSQDALLHGALGLLVDPKNVEAIYTGLLHLLENPLSVDEKQRRLEKISNHFSFDIYSEKVNGLLQKSS